MVNKAKRDISLHFLMTSGHWWECEGLVYLIDGFSTLLYMCGMYFFVTIDLDVLKGFKITG